MPVYEGVEILVYCFIKRRECMEGESGMGGIHDKSLGTSCVSQNAKDTGVKLIAWRIQLSIYVLFLNPFVCVCVCLSVCMSV